MNAPFNSSQRARWSALFGVLVAGGAMFTALLVRRSRRASDPSFNAFADESVAKLPPQAISNPVKATSSEPVIEGQFSPVRWLVFIAVLFLLGVLLITLQDAAPTISITLFGLLLAGAGVLALWRSPQTVQRFVNAVAAGVSFVTQTVAYGITVPFVFLRHFLLSMSDRVSASAARLAVVAMLIAALTFWFLAPATSAMTAAVVLVILGTLFIGLSVMLTPNLTAIAQIDLTAEKVTNRSGWIITGLGIVILAVLAEIGGKMFHIDALASVDSNVQFLMLIVGIALLVIGLSGGGVMPYLYRALLNFLRPAQTTVAVTPTTVSGRFFDAATVKSWALRLFTAITAQYAVLFLTLLALVLRFWELNHVYRFFIDELLNIDAVMYVLGNHDAPLLAPFSSIAAFPYLFPYWQTTGVVLFGHTYMGVRAASAILGTLAIPGLYWLVKTLFDRRTAFIAALLLATFPPHLQFSRMGINEMGGPLFAVYAFLFLARGVVYNKRFDYALGGALLGLTHYFDEGARLLFTPMTIAWMLGLLVIWKPRRRLRNYLVALIALLVVAIPIYYTLSGLRLSMAARMVDNSSGLSGAYWQELFDSNNFQQHINYHIIPAFTVYFFQLDGTLFYKGETAMLLVYVVPFFLLGLAYMLWHWRSPGPMLFLLWVFCVSLGNSILVASASYPRFVIVFAALAAVVAVGIRYSVPLVLQSANLRRWQVPVIMSLGIALAVLQTGYYFNVHIPTFSTQFRDNWPHPDPEDAILRTLDVPQGTELHYVSVVPPDVNYNKGAANFLNGRVYVDTLTPDQLTTSYFLNLTCGIEHVFLLNTDDFESLRRVQRYFTLEPGQWSPYDDIPPRKQFVMFRAHELPASTSIYTNRCP